MDRKDKNQRCNSDIINMNRIYSKHFQLYNSYRHINLLHIDHERNQAAQS